MGQKGGRRRGQAATVEASQWEWQQRTRVEELGLELAKARAELAAMRKRVQVMSDQEAALEASMGAGGKEGVQPVAAMGGMPLGPQIPRRGDGCGLACWRRGEIVQIASNLPAFLARSWGIAGYEACQGVEAGGSTAPS